MKNIKVLGSGCTKCLKTAELIQHVANDLSVEIHLEKETSAQAIMGYGVMSTPAVVINEKVVHSGSMPTKEQIGSWFLTE